MRYKYTDTIDHGSTQRNVIIETAPDQYTSFPATIGNPAYDGFLTQTGLTDEQVQEVEPDVWHDMPAVTE